MQPQCEWGWGQLRRLGGLLLRPSAAYTVELLLLLLCGSGRGRRCCRSRRRRADRCAQRGEEGFTVEWTSRGAEEACLVSRMGQRMKCRSGEAVGDQTGAELVVRRRGGLLQQQRIRVQLEGPAQSEETLVVGGGGRGGRGHRGAAHATAVSGAVAAAVAAGGADYVAAAIKSGERGAAQIQNVLETVFCDLKLNARLSMRH